MNSTNSAEPINTDVVSAVKAATAAAGKRTKSGGFSLTTAGVGEWVMAAILGVYLGFAVVRLPEVFLELAIPKLPMMLMLTFLASLIFIVPSDGWRAIWNHSKSLRLVATIVGIAIITAPLGIWPSESFLFLRDYFAVAVAVFLCCLVFLRDRRTFRLAVAVYVLCVGAVSYDVIHTYNPEGPFYDEDGEVIDPEVLAVRPELRRLQSVGISLDPNDFGAILATTFPLALWLSVGSLRRRVFWTGVAALFVAALVPTQSRGSMLGFLAAATVLIGAGATGWRRWLSILLVGGGVAIFVVMATGIGAGDRFADISGGDYNVSGNEGRFYFWRQGFIWMLKRPWGYGITNFATYFGILNGEERAAHSTWVQYGMELGVAGLITFVMLCRAVVGGLRKLRRAALASVDNTAASRDEAVLAGHLLAMMAGTLTTATFLSNAYYPLTYMALGLCAAALLGTQVEMAEPVAAAPTPDLSEGGALPRRRLRAMQSPRSGA